MKWSFGKKLIFRASEGDGLTEGNHSDWSENIIRATDLRDDIKD